MKKILLFLIGFMTVCAWYFAIGYIAVLGLDLDTTTWPRSVSLLYLLVGGINLGLFYAIFLAIDAGKLIASKFQ